MLLSLFVLLLSVIQADKQTVTFNSPDGVVITADKYAPNGPKAPWIILFHQANWSRGEYLEIAPKLTAMGFNCLAVDLRSGGTINNVRNATKADAVSKLKETNYIDALPDMIAAINYTSNTLNAKKIILWGSSYSSSLVLKLAADMPDKIHAVLAFSPGEYFTSMGKPRDFVTSSAANITCPVFITSAHNEKNNWWGIYVAISNDKKVYYWPSTTGNHGSRALWKAYNDSSQYWTAVKTFLESI